MDSVLSKFCRSISRALLVTAAERLVSSQFPNDLYTKQPTLRDKNLKPPLHRSSSSHYRSSDHRSHEGYPARDTIPDAPDRIRRAIAVEG